MKYGQQVQIARRAGITRQQLNDFLQRRKECKSAAMALDLEKASLEVLGNANLIPWYEFMRSFTTKNKFFKRNEKVIISKDIAEEHGIEEGDILTVEQHGQTTDLLTAEIKE